MEVDNLSIFIGGSLGTLKSGEVKSFLYGGTTYEAQYQYQLSSSAGAATIKLPHIKGQYSESNAQVGVGILLGKYKYDPNGLFQSCIVTDIEFHAYDYETKVEKAYLYKIEGAGRFYDTSKVFASELIYPSQPDVAIKGYYSSDNTLNIYNDEFKDNNAKWASYPISHDRSTLKGFPDGASFPVGWWNDPFNQKFSDGNQQNTSTPISAKINTPTPLTNTPASSGSSTTSTNTRTQQTPQLPTTMSSNSSKALPISTAPSGITPTSASKLPQPSAAAPVTTGISTTKALPKNTASSGISPASPSNRAQQPASTPFASGASGSRSLPSTTGSSGSIPTSASTRPQPTSAPAISPSSNAAKRHATPPLSTKTTLPTNPIQNAGNVRTGMAADTLNNQQQTNGSGGIPAPIGKDIITGASWNLDGFNIRSGQVYTNNSKLRRLIPTADTTDPSTFSWSQEFELGRHYLVMNAVSAKQGELGHIDTITERLVLEGDFNFTQGILNSAVIIGFSESRHSTANNLSASESTTINNGFGYDFNTTAGMRVKEPTSSASLTEALTLGANQGSRIFEYDEQSYGGATSGNKAGFLNYKSNNTFFQDGWWNNPFASNFI